MDQSTLHHINLPAYRVRAMADFYRQALDLGEVDSPAGGRETVVLDAGGGRQLHLTRPVPSLSFEVGQFVNPVLRGHVAFQVPSVEAVMGRLESLNLPFADYGMWALPTTRQIYFYDPEGSVVEAFEVVNGGSV
jgi:catechol 2,3-dioxygenase-like lactoylglutathione lyase family enzyme